MNLNFFEFFVLHIINNGIVYPIGTSYKKKKRIWMVIAMFCGGKTCQFGNVARLFVMRFVHLP